MRECMAYVMNHGGISPPSSQYYNGIKQGYDDNGMDVSYLRDALQRSHDVMLVATECMDEEPDETEDMQMGWE